MQRFQRILALAVFVLSLFASGAEASMVLCIEPDGRIFIENRSESCCEVGETVLAAPESNVALDSFLEKYDPDCDCIDISLATGATTATTRNDQFKGIDPISPATNLLRLIPSEISRESWKTQTYISTNPLHQYSVVLRI